MEGRIVAGQAGCAIPLSVALFEGQGIGPLIEDLGAGAGVEVASPAKVLCDGEACRTREGETILYRDNGHLTRDGARVVVDGLGLRAIMSAQQ